MADRILLIRPKNIYNYNNYPPLNLISLASRLKSSGYGVKIINCAYEKDPLTTIGKELKDSLFVGVTLSTSEIPDAYRIMKFVKQKSVRHYELRLRVVVLVCPLKLKLMIVCDRNDLDQREVNLLIMIVEKVSVHNRLDRDPPWVQDQQRAAPAAQVVQIVDVFSLVRALFSLSSLTMEVIKLQWGPSGFQL